jgi:integrase/recombinase XerD
MSLTRMALLQSETEGRVSPDPAAAYLARIGPGSRRAMRQVLSVIANELGGDLGAIAWHDLRYPHTQAVRSKLMATYAPATANRALAALKGVLKEAFRLGLMDAESCHRATDLAPVRGSRVLRGRALSLQEIALLFRACAPGTKQGLRDAAALALCFGAGLRRAEVVAIQLADYDVVGQSITVVGKGNKQRRVCLGTQIAMALTRWIEERGTEPGALLLAINKADRVEHRQLSPEAIAVMLKRLAKRAGTEAVSPHDLRRTFVSELLSAGADLATVQALAGHSNPATTVRYDRRGEDAQRRALELLALPSTYAAA